MGSLIQYKNGSVHKNSEGRYFIKTLGESDVIVSIISGRLKLNIIKDN